MRRRLGNSSSNPPEAVSTPSAEDQSKSRPGAQEDTAEQTTTPDQRGVARGSADRSSGKGQGEPAAIADEGVSATAGATVNPFWSERAKREAQLVAARPDFLGGVAGQTSRGPSSTSTEMRPSEEMPATTGSTGPEHPAGAPVSFGPPATVQTTVGEQEAVGSGQPAGEPGLRPAERQVLTEMKGILEMLVNQNTELREQNAGLQSRLEKLEEDRSAAWRSVASGGVQEGAEQPGLGVGGVEDRDWSQLGFYVPPEKLWEDDNHPHPEPAPASSTNNPKETCEYQLGFEEGYYAAREVRGAEREDLNRSPPSVQDWRVQSELNLREGRLRERTPEPPAISEAHEGRINVTPKGTPVPPSPPPPPLPDQRILGAPTATPGSLRDLSERVMGSVKGSDLTGIFEGIPVAPSAIRASHLGVGFNESNSFQEAADPGWEKGVLRGRPDAHDDLVDPWQGLDITGLGVGPGRDPFVPGERTFWNLPTLEDPSQPSPATRASDWLVQIRPMLYDLSDMSQSWWQRVEFESQGWYQRWCRASALERGLIVPQMSPELSHMRFRRLESRAYGMLQTAVPAVIRDELLASRSLNCMSLLFQVLKVYAPGGLQERTQILGELTNLGIARNASEAVQALRSWNRTYARARTMGVSVPDPALVLRGLDALTEGLLRKAVHAQVSFRVSTARNHLRLDHNPTMGSVMEFLKILQSEWEQVSVSGQEETPKPPKAARLEAEAKGEPKGEKGGDEKGKNLKGKGRDEKGSYGGGKASDAQPSAGGKGSKGLCSFYLTSQGCSKGRECSHYHDFSTAKGQSRCYNCGSDQHRQQDCSRPKGKGKGKPLGESRGNPTTMTSAPNSSPVPNHVAPPENASKPPETSAAANSNKATSVAAAGSGNSGGPSRTTATQVSQTQVLEEAQKLLKSLRIAALAVAPASGAEVKHEVNEAVGQHVHEKEENGQGECEGPEGETERESEVLVREGPRVEMRKIKGPTGLLDGGATHALRSASPGEWSVATPTRVDLAIGSQELRISSLGTVLSRDLISPICPLGALVSELGCRVRWDAGRCMIHHPVRGVLDTELENGCPTVTESLCLQLIGELEQCRAQKIRRALNLRALKLGSPCEESDQPCAWGSESDVLRALREICPEESEGILARAVPNQCGEYPVGASVFLGLNRRARKAIQHAKHVVLNLCPGKPKVSWQKMFGAHTVVLTIATSRNPGVFDERTFSWLATLCASGKVAAVVGSQSRVVSDCRGKSESSVDAEVAQETQLIQVLRTLVLHRIAENNRAGGSVLVLEGSSRAKFWDRLHLPLWSRNELSVQSEPQNLGELGGQWYRAEFELATVGMVMPRKSALLTNSWDLFTLTHARDGEAGFRGFWQPHGCQAFGGLGGPHEGPSCEHTPQSADWPDELVNIVTRTLRRWISEKEEKREERQRDERVTLSALSREEEEFKKHCEQDHVVFRRDCKVCLQSAMRGPRHFRQKHRHANALTLNLDLIGPWTAGDDHALAGPARHILVATLGVPILKDGKPLPLEKETEGEEKEREEGNEDDGGGVGPIGPEDGDDQLVLEDPESKEESEEGELSPEEYAALYERQEAKWREIAKELQEPVQVHEVLFAEPLQSKRSEEVLRGIQRIYSKITVMNLSVRRTHSDGGREFTNRGFKSWCASRDIHPTYSPPGDPKANGRIENAVGRVKSGIRALLLSAPDLEKSSWPSALRQYVEQKFRASMKVLGGERPKRALPPFGAKVMVQSRSWSKKTPYAPRAIEGIALCPSSNIRGCTVVLLPEQEGDKHSRFHVAPVVYAGVRDPIKFVGEIDEEEPPLPPPSHPPPRRRISSKRPVVAHACVGGESGSETESREENLTCQVCEETIREPGSIKCSLCGLRVSDKLSVEESEARAEQLLNAEPVLRREDVDQLIADSLWNWKPKTRKVDQGLQGSGALGWTLGFYRHGPKIGVTKETIRRPRLTQVLNRYMIQEGDRLGRPGFWCSVRVTSNFTSEIHRDKNEPGSLNFVVPVSRFGGGRIWIEGGPDTSSESLGTEGKYVGGELQPTWFDASQPHAVEPSQGTRRVLVGYTPRELGRLPSDLRDFLLGLSFPLPPIVSLPATPEPVSDSAKAETEGPTLYEDVLSDSEVHSLRCEHVMLRQLLIEQHKCYDEEVTVAASEGRTASNLHLHDLCTWIDECEQGLVWQDTCDLLKSGAVGEAESAVLGARLAHLGVSWDSASEVGVSLYRDEGSGEGLSPEEEVMPSAWEAQPAQPLQTVSVSHQEVLKRVEDWKGAIVDELSNVFDVHEAMRRCSESELQAWKEAGEQVEILPAKAIFQKKGGSGRHKCRVVACGNFSESAKHKNRDQKLQCYAGGADSLSLRCHLRAAGHRAQSHGWRTSGADIRTAFLLAPLRQNQKRTVLRPPSVLVQAGFAAPGEYWEITGALYGLQTSPADWAIYRDETLPTLDVWCGDQKTHLRRSKHDPNLWLLYCPKTSRLIAALTIYVDDLLLSGTPEASQAVWEAIKAKWKISEPEYADQGVVTFCGFEIRQQPDGIHVGQAKYVQSLLDKYSEVTGTSSCPYARESEVIDAKPQESIEKLRRAQAVAGELLWLATRTRPDLAFGVSRIGQLITKDVDQALRRGEEMIKYLRTTKQQELIYGEPGLGHGAADQLPVARDFNLIEVFADASFCPGTDRSQSGIVLMWGNCPIGWMSMRQPCASLSTAEAELQSSLDGMTLAEGIYGLLEELAEAPQSAFLYNDNVGACTVMTLPQGSWRTRHLRLKAAWFMEQLERARFRVYHVPGQYMLGDLCTKSLQGVRVRELLQMMSVRLDPSKVDGGESASASTSTSTSSSTSSSNSSSSTGKPVVQKVVAGSGGASTRESTGSSGTGGASGAVRALRALTVANALRAVTSKLVHVSVDIDESQASEIAELKTTLQLVCCVLTIVGVLALACWCCENKESVPRIQALSSRVRDQDSEITDDGEWSMIEEQFTEALTSGREPEETTTGRTTRAGLRNRLGSRSLAASASDDPRGSRINSPEEEDRRWLGSGSSVPNIPSGSSSTPTPREGRRSHPGGGLLSSPSSLPGEGMLNASQPGREMSGLPQGVLHDDGASGADLAEGSPAGELDGLNEGTGRGELEHDLQEDANAEIVNVRRSRETERERLEIHPGWTLRLPPRFSWDPKPEWGSWESLFHQSIPKAVKRDFYYHDRVRSVLVRFHAQERRQLFVPSPGGLPESVSWANLTGRRRTFHRGVTTNPAGILEDEWNVPHPKPARQISTEKWIGRTEFELQDS